MDTLNNRTDLFATALAECSRLLAAHPANVVLASIRSQLRYLINLDAGIDTDRSRLAEIIIDRQTAHDIEPLDMRVADIFYDVAEAASKM